MMLPSPRCPGRTTPALGRHNGLFREMGIFARLARLLRANLDDLTRQGDDPEATLDQAISEMSERLLEAKNLVSASTLEETRLARQAEDESVRVQPSQREAPSLGDARAASLRQCIDRLEEQRRATRDLKTALAILNDKIEQAKLRRDALRLRRQSAQVTEAIHGSVGSIETDSISHLLDRLEGQVQRLEARARAAAELDERVSEPALASTPPELGPPRAPVPRALGPQIGEAEQKDATLSALPGEKQRTPR